MTNEEKLREIYDRKVAEGLVDVKFVFADTAKTATLETLYGEVLAMEEAISEGKTRPLDFGDLSFKRAEE